MKIPFTCPVCHGKGIVPPGFYSSTQTVWIGTSLEPDKCKSCSGTGLKFEFDPPECTVPAAELQPTIELLHLLRNRYSAVIHPTSVQDINTEISRLESLLGEKGGK